MIILEFLQQVPTVAYLFALILGLIIGSFLNVVIYRLPIMLIDGWKQDCVNFLSEQDKAFTYKYRKPDSPFNLATPSSSCPQCQHKISALENIPILSYLFLKGRCKNCKAKIPLRYPSIELLSGLITLTVVYYLGISWQSLFALVLSWNLIAMSGIDYDHQYLPDSLTLPFIWAGLLINSFSIFIDLQSAVIGAIAGYMILWLVYHVFKLITKKEGMGYGDFKLLALFGAWFGWQSLAAIIILSSLAGAIIGIGLIIFKKQSISKKIPFGPYLAVAGWIFMLWGQSINSWYLNYVGLS